MVWDWGSVGNGCCDESTVSDDCVGRTVEESGLTNSAEEGSVDVAADGAADGAAEGAAEGTAFVEAAALLAAGVLDVGLGGLGVTPVPIGTFCCRL